MSEKYEMFQKKYKLPGLNDIEKEFNFEAKKKTAEEIIEEMIDVFSDNAKLLESLLFIDSGSPVSKMYEASMLREKEIDVFDMYKDMMSLFWLGKKSLLNGENIDKAEFISKSFVRWKKMKQELAKIFDLFEKEWPNVAFRQADDVVYHG